MKIYSHSFEYGRGKPKELENYCEKVFYYSRNQFTKSIFSKTPFIARSRASKELIENLKIDKAPILFEGLHTTHPLIETDFHDRRIAIRTHNIEHLYYDGLSKSEQRLDKKLFFKSESKKLLAYEQILNKADYIFTISPFEQDYFRQKFGNKTNYIPVFHQNKTIESLSKRGKFALYHGDLRVSDNIKSVDFLIDVFKEIDYPFIIASSFINEAILKKIKKYNHIKFSKINDKNDIASLLSKAHINSIPTFQKTGIKLKLINILFCGRHILTTTQMVEDTGLENLCFVEKTKKGFIEKILKLIDTDFSKGDYVLRKEKLKEFDAIASAQKIITLLS